MNKDLRKLVMETVDKILTENPEEVLRAAIAKYSTQVDESEIRKLFDADKTSGKNHFSWLLKNYIDEKNVLKPDGEMTLADYMAEKYQLLMRLQHIDGMPKNFKAMKFSAVLLAMSDVFRKKSEDSDRETATVDKSLVKAYEDDEFVLYEVLSKEASCHFGDGTSWCISKREEQNYEHYEADGCKFFALLFKTKTYNATLKSGQKKNQNYRHMIVVSRDGRPPEVLPGGILEWRNPNQTNLFSMNEVPAKSFNGIIQFFGRKFPNFSVGEKTIEGLPYRNGLLHGEVISPGKKRVYENGQLSNKNGPAFIYWHSNGAKWSERFYLDGKYHRTDGPAITIWNSNGEKKAESFYVNGEELTKDAFMKRFGKHPIAESTVIRIPQSRQLITESFLTMWGHSIRKALEKMFDIPVYENITFQGRRTDVEALYRTLGAEKRYIDSFINNGLSDPRVTNSKWELEKAIHNFESQTGIKWPII